MQAGPARGVGLLDSAAARSRSSVCGEDAYATLELEAAALLHSIARNHALVDGNKRLAWLPTVVFLDLNGRAPTLSHDAAFALVMGAADGTLDVEQVAGQLQVAA